MFTVSRLIRGSVLSLSALVVAAGCGDEENGPETPVELCDRVARAECDKLYACTTESIRAMFGLVGPVGNCYIGLATQIQCEAATADKICAGTTNYTVAQANTCIAEANAATCAQVIANTTNVRAYAPSCGQCVPAFTQ